MKADRIIFATGNEGKMKEIRMILADMKLPIQSMKEADIHIDIEENVKGDAVKSMYSIVLFLLVFRKYVL